MERTAVVAQKAEAGARIEDIEMATAAETGRPGSDGKKTTWNVVWVTES